MSEWVRKMCVWKRGRAEKRRQRAGLRVDEVKTDKLRWRIICGGPLQWGVRPRWSTPIQTPSLSLCPSHPHTHCTHTAHTKIALFFSFSSFSSPSSSLSLPFLLLSLKTHPSYFLFLFFQHSCSWISKGTLPAEKTECLAGRSLSQAGWDCGIPASHSLGTVFAPSGAPAITASGLLLHLHLQPRARALFANWAWRKQ